MYKLFLTSYTLLVVKVINNKYYISVCFFHKFGVMKITKNGAIAIGVGVGIALSAGFIYVNRHKIKKGVESIVDYAFSKEQESFIKELHPKYRNVFRKFIADIEKNTPYRVLITSGYRSFAKQAELHAENSANAKAGNSLHNYGLAIDINLVNKKTGALIKKASTDKQWKDSGVLAIAEKNGLDWGGGGNFGSYDDRVHFSVPLSGSKLYADALKQFGSDKKIIGNQVKIA